MITKNRHVPIIIISLIILTSLIANTQFSNKGYTFITNQYNTQILSTIEYNDSEYISVESWVQNFSFNDSISISIQINDKNLTYRSTGLEECFTSRNSSLIAKNTTLIIEKYRDELIWYQTFVVNENYGYIILAGFNRTTFVEIGMIEKFINNNHNTSLITLNKVYVGSYIDSMEKAITTYYNLNSTNENWTIDTTVPYPVLWNFEITGTVIGNGNDGAYNEIISTYTYINIPESTDHWEFSTSGYRAQNSGLSDAVVCILMNGSLSSVWFFGAYPKPYSSTSNIYLIGSLLGIVVIISIIIIIKKD